MSEMSMISSYLCIGKIFCVHRGLSLNGAENKNKFNTNNDYTQYTLNAREKNANKI